jgi:hypothetical protein
VGVAGWLNSASARPLGCSPNGTRLDSSFSFRSNGLKQPRGRPMPNLDHLRIRNREDAHPSPPAARRNRAASTGRDFHGLSGGPGKSAYQHRWDLCRVGTGSRRRWPARPRAKSWAGGAGMSEPPKWYQHNADNPPWLKSWAGTPAPRDRA